MNKSIGFLKIFSVLLIVCTAQIASAQVVQAHMSVSNSNLRSASHISQQIWVPGAWHVHHRTGVRTWYAGYWTQNNRKFKRKNRRSIRRCNRR